MVKKIVLKYFSPNLGLYVCTFISLIIKSRLYIFLPLELYILSKNCRPYISSFPLCTERNSLTGKGTEKGSQIKKKHFGRVASLIHCCCYIDSLNHNFNIYRISLNLKLSLK